MNPVLLLNASYEPLSVVTARRAVILTLTGKAELVHELEGVFLRSASLIIEHPSVIRLTRYVVVPYRANAPLTRQGIFRRDGYRCVYCGKAASTVDHVVPRSRGGANTWKNLVSSCRDCNHSKGDRLLSELGWKLRIAPYAPTHHQSVLNRFGEPHPSWLTYLPSRAA